MKSFYYNIEDAEFVDSSGEKVSMCVPELFYQERAVWRIFLRDRENGVRDLSGIAAWGAAVDCDYRSETAPMCRSLDEDIVADAEHGSVTVEINAATAEFLAAVDGSPRRKAFFELYGLDADGEREIQLVFEIAARMIIDPDPAESPEVPETLATKSYVTARIGSAADSAYASACAGVSGAMASGGYVTSSGAAAIASGAAASAFSGALVSGAEIVTSVGGYTVALTGGGGLAVSGGGAQFLVSGGRCLMSAGDAQIGVDRYGGTTINGNSPINITANIGAGVNISAYDINLDPEGNVFVNSRPVALELVTSTDSESVSASIDVLAGGTSYIYTQPLASLAVASVASSMQEAWIEFTVASGGSVSINDSGYRWLGGRPSAFEGGSSYAVGFMGDMAVCNTLEE